MTTSGTTQHLSDHAELAEISDVVDRYRLPGPHVTLVMRFSPPGTIGDDVEVQWHARRADLHRAGAPDEILERLDRVVEILPREGDLALITADMASAAVCWFGSESSVDPDAQPATFGDVPHLLHALHSVSARPNVIAAIVDRVGADVLHVRHRGWTTLDHVEGNGEEIHRGAERGTSESARQRHADVWLDRNAELIAEALSEFAVSAGTTLVVVTGEERAAPSVERHLVARRSLEVHRVHAGGRHEPDSPQRVDEAAREIARHAHQARIDAELDDLREELGQHDQGAQGEVAVLEALAHRRVGKLFVDLDEAARHPNVDAIVHAALSSGADVLTVDGLAVTDGVAAILRYR